MCKTSTATAIKASAGWPPPILFAMDKIRVEDLPGAVREVLATGPRISATRKWRAGPTRGELEKLLRAHRGKVSAVAKVLDRQWTVVQRWLRQHDLDADRYRV